MKKLILALLYLGSLANFSCREERPTPNVTTPLRLRSVQTIGGSWNSKEDYTYYTDGRIDQIVWQRNTPYTTQGVDQYQYDANLRLAGINRKVTGLVDEEIRYTYDGSRIAAAASYFNGAKQHYTFFDYNAAGQLIKEEFYTSDASANGFLLAGEVRYSYHHHGNVREIGKYVFDREQQQMKVHTIKIYNNYILDKSAVLDSEPSLPGMRLQKNLPVGYVVNTSGADLRIDFSYRWLPNGNILDRTVQYPNGNTEQAIYQFD